MTRKKILIAVLGILLLVNMFGCALGIHDAARIGRVDIVNSLLAEDPERVSAKDKEGLTPLHFAALYDHKEIAELLIAKGADVNAKDKDGWTPLHETGKKDVAELLIAKGADVNAKDKEGLTPLHFAALYDHTAVAELLRRRGGK